MDSSDDVDLRSRIFPFLICIVAKTLHEYLIWFLIDHSVVGATKREENMGTYRSTKSDSGI